MKAVIIGGGIAGITLGILLKKNHYEVVINERSANMPAKGHAFLMHTDGLAVLNQLGNDEVTLPGKMLNAFSLRRPNGKEIKYLQLDTWKCIKRYDLLHFLSSLFPQEYIKEGRIFSHFIYQDDKVIAAAFLNGDVEYGDIFIGADGGNSKVREVTFGKTYFTPVRVKEIVGITVNEEIAKLCANTFVKFQDENKGLAFGMIPTSGNEFVWFIQYDATLNDIADSSPDELKSFCSHLVKDFPPVVADLLSSNNFATSYLWNTRDFDLLSTFHHKNVVLLGDAAHLALPFTSAGTTSAILDAEALCNCLCSANNYEEAFDAFYKQRAEEVEKNISLGRNLKELFLNPQQRSDDDIPVPLVSVKHYDDDTVPKPIQILYFTDPICSTCWIIQPFLRKLTLEYGNYINIKYYMGGLLPSWEEYTKGKISTPLDAANHWEEGSALYNMPMDGDVWIENPLYSSYPPSIAFKAAQMQDKNSAILFLRRIKEMVFLEKKNINYKSFLEEAAFEVGLDSARLLKDMDGRAKELFFEDLTLAKQLGITSFPTLIFSNTDGERVTIKGYHPYEKFEDIIFSLIPKVEKLSVCNDPKSLFTQFNTMAEKEFAYLSDVSNDEALKTLNELYEEGCVCKYNSKNGVIWKNNFIS